MPDEPVDVAVLLNSESVNEWQRRALTALLDGDPIDARATTLVINAAEEDSGSAIKEHLSEFSLWKVLRATHLVRFQISGRPWYDERTDVSAVDALDDARTVRCRPQPADGLGNTLPEKAVDRLADTDVAIRFGFGIVKGDALTAPTYGMLSYHHGDLRAYRGRPAGFHEFRRGEPTVGVTVQKLNESLDGGDIAAFTEVDIRDATSWLAVLSRLYEASEDLLPQAVANAASGDLETDPEPGDLYRMPSTRQTIQYLRETLRRPYSTADLPSSD